MEYREQEISRQLQEFAASLKNYTSQYETIIVDISTSLPVIEKQIDNNVLEARELLNFICSTGERGSESFGVRHELIRFHSQLNEAMNTLQESENVDKKLFKDLRKTIETSQSAINKIEDIYNISENLKVFAINSIVYSQKEGTRGEGYQVISIEFIKLSEEIAKGTEQINALATRMDSLITGFLKLISTHEDFTKNNIETVSKDSEKLMSTSDSSVENFSLILSDLLNRIESVESPTYNIMIQLQKQDIIQQQMVHLLDSIEDILQLLNKEEDFLKADNLESLTREEMEESLSSYTLLDFLLRIIEKQTRRVNQDLLDMISEMEGQFSAIYTAIDDISSDKELINQLVIPGKETKEEASIVHLLFMAPEKTISEIIKNLNHSKVQKKHIVENFKSICSLILEEKKQTSSFVPLFESINNLLMLAKIEQARNNLDISGSIDDKNSFFNEASFSRLTEIEEKMNESSSMVHNNLQNVIQSFEKQHNQYIEMEEKLRESLKILSNTEELFRDNYGSVIQITDILSSEMRKYTSLFENLRKLHRDMNFKLEKCSQMRQTISTTLNRMGGPLELKECHFSNSIIQRIVERCTVEDERDTLSKEITDLDIEKSTGSNITLF